MYTDASPPLADTASASFSANLRDALRLAVWRAPRDPDARMSALAMVGIFAAIALASLATQFYVADADWRTFNPYGLPSQLAGQAVEAAIIVAFAHFDRTQATTRKLMLAFALIAVASLCLRMALHAALPEYPRGLTLRSAVGASIVGLLAWVWVLGALRQAFRAARRPTLRAFVFYLALAVAVGAVPRWPAFVPENFDRRTANLMEYVWSLAYGKQEAAQATARRAEARKRQVSAARLEAMQHLLFSDAVGKLAARDPAAANVFTIGVAGWSDQDVFLKEIRQSTDILKSHFKLGERTLNLINNASTAKEAPMASMANIGEGLRAVARRMDRDKDLLVLVLSSHGSRDGFALSYDDMVERTLDPETLRLMLDAAKIKNRVVIVSSCYAGTFIAPLKTSDTMILTAADAEHTSFGCSDDRHWTWFGEALFEKGLADHATLADAFAAAKATIAGWEREQEMTASNPQMFVGDDIARNFPDIVGRPAPAALGAVAPAASPTKTE
jgi:hypothetical protein